MPCLRVLRYLSLHRIFIRDIISSFFSIIPAFSFVPVAGGGSSSRGLWNTTDVHTIFSCILRDSLAHNSNYRRALSVPCGGRRDVACQALDDDVTRHQ